MKGTFKLKILVTMSLLSFSSLICSQDSAQNNEVKEESSQQENAIKIPFTASANALSKNTNKDNIDWFNLMGEQHLVFKRNNKGRIFRGNAILFHTKGENPRHDRLINPLSIQLSNLGWNTFSPNISFPDFPSKVPLGLPNQPEQSAEAENLPKEEVPIDSEATSENSKLSETEIPALDNTKTSYFKTQESYQEYFTSVCQETLKLVINNDQPTVIFANGEAAYWMLECIALMPAETPVILIEPKAPLFAHENLDSKLQSRSNPLFTFAINTTEKDYFVSRIKKGNWKASIQRYNESTLLNSKLYIENTTLAKSTTGWVKTLSTPSQ